MEEKALKLIEEQKNSEDGRIELQGLYLVKITPKIKEAIEKVENIKALCLQNCKLNSLENFPVLKGLKELDLSDNYLRDESIEVLKDFNDIKYLFLGGNKIRKMESMSFLKNFDNLKQIDVFDCPFTNKDGYQYKLFGMGKNLLIVDGMNIDGVEVSLTRSDDTEENEDSEEQDDYEENEDEEQGDFLNDNFQIDENMEHIELDQENEEELSSPNNTEKSEKSLVQIENKLEEKTQEQNKQDENLKQNDENIKEFLQAHKKLPKDNLENKNCKKINQLYVQIDLFNYFYEFQIFKIFNFQNLLNFGEYAYKQLLFLLQ